MTNKNNPDHDQTIDAQSVLNQVVLQYFKDHKRNRIWRWFKRSIFLLVIIWLAYSIVAGRASDIATRTQPHVGLIDIKGSIMDDQGGNADDFMTSMTKAYKNTSMKALILRIDSPGGSPVQADYMFNAVRYFRTKHPDIKVYAVCVDLCASAAYYVAAATDEIYANPSSMVGSIGVVYNGFGFVDVMQKVGVTRRLQTAGLNKGFLDPFSPENPAQNKMLQTMLDLIHRQFIDKVKEGRGARLHVDDQTFSGLVWTGIQAKERGLIDGFASTGQLSRDIIKIDRLVDYTTKQNIFQQMSKSVGTSMANQLPEALGLKQRIQ